MGELAHQLAEIEGELDALTRAALGRSRLVFGVIEGVALAEAGSVEGEDHGRIIAATPPDIRAGPRAFATTGARDRSERLVRCWSAMAIPDFQALMLPMLRLAADGQERALSSVTEQLAVEFKLSDAERDELLPSGRQARFNNRVGWAKTYLKKTALLEDVSRGRFRITDRGRLVLKQAPKAITLKYLERFPELAQFRGEEKGTGDDDRTSESSIVDAAANGSATPEEQLDASYIAVRSKLAEDLLERVKSYSPRFFEKLVVDVLVAMGYGGSLKDAGRAVGQSGDGGIDGIIKADRLGLDAIYIQAKRWEATVGRPVVQAFAGSLEGQRARKGVLITTSQFSGEARDYVSRIEKKIVLIDGAELAQLMIDYDVGVAVQQTYVLKKLDLDYFTEDADG